MKTTIMAKNIQQDNISSSKRQFHWTTKVSNEADHHQELPIPSLRSSSNTQEMKPENHKQVKKKESLIATTSAANAARKKLQAVAIWRWRSVLTALARNRGNFQHGGGGLGLGSRVMGTLFGNRKGNVHFAIQKDPNSSPAFLIELSTPITGLIKEMASGLVRIALECDKKEKQITRLLEEPLWRTFCNGKKCGFSTRRECGSKELTTLKAIEPISMGAGVLPPPSVADNENYEKSSEGEIMYMRAKFQRVVGSRDSEAFYMMNPDSNSAPELSIYLLRF